MQEMIYEGAIGRALPRSEHQVQPAVGVLGRVL